MLTDSEKADVLFYLGYEAAQVYYDRVSKQCDQVSLIGAAFDGRIRQILHELGKISKDINDARLGAGRSFQSSSTSTAQYYRGDRMLELRQAGRQAAAQLAQATRLEVVRDVFNPSSVRSSGQVFRA